MPKRKFSENALITRNYNLELRANDTETGVIEGTPIVFDQATLIHDWFGDFNEIIDRNALKNTDLRDVLLFTNHDMNKIALARSKNGNENSTMSFTIDDEGLHIRAFLDVENNSEARALYSAIKRGDVDGMSFAFRINDEEWRDIESEVPTRVVKGISIVHEVSVVNYPAYPQTSVSARAKGEEAPYSPLEEARKAHSKEIEEKKSKEAEVEKLKYEYLIKGAI